MVRVFSAAVLSIAFCAPAIAGVVFSNTTPIDIPGTGDIGPANPFPSSINVSGLTGNVTDVNVTIRGLSHEFSDDIEMVLVGPGGRWLILGTDLGDEAVVRDVTITFDDSAASALTTWATSGTFRPEAPNTTPNPIGIFDYLTVSTANNAVDLAGFNGVSGNGTWSLYISDDVIWDVGRLAGGWSLEITTDGVPVPEPATLPLLGTALLGLVAVRRRMAQADKH